MVRTKGDGGVGRGAEGGRDLTVKWLPLAPHARTPLLLAGATFFTRTYRVFPTAACAGFVEALTNALPVAGADFTYSRTLHDSAVGDRGRGRWCGHFHTAAHHPIKGRQPSPAAASALLHAKQSSSNHVVIM